MLDEPFVCLINLSGLLELVELSIAAQFFAFLLLRHLIKVRLAIQKLIVKFGRTKLALSLAAVLSAIVFDLLKYAVLVLDRSDLEALQRLSQVVGRSSN